MDRLDQPSFTWRLAISAAQLARQTTLAEALDEWARQDFSPSAALTWRPLGPDGAHAWRTTGLTPSEAISAGLEFRLWGINDHAAVSWHDTLNPVLPSLTPSELTTVAAAWHQHGLTPATAAPYLRHGLGRYEGLNLRLVVQATALASDAATHRHDLYGEHLDPRSPLSLYDAPKPMDALDQALLEPELRALDDRYEADGVPLMERAEWDRVMHKALHPYVGTGTGTLDVDIYPPLAQAFRSQHLAPSTAERYLPALLDSDQLREATKRRLSPIEVVSVAPRWTRYCIDRGFEPDQIAEAVHASRSRVVDLRDRSTTDELLARLPAPTASPVRVTESPRTDLGVER